MDDVEEEITNTENTDLPFQTVLAKRLSRRALLGDMAVISAAVSLPAAAQVTSSREGAETTLTFTELSHDLDANFAVPPGYQYQVLIRWGDPLFNDSIEFDPLKQTKESQLSQFGYNNDFVGFVPLPLGSKNSDSGLLTVNHEFTSPRRMHPGSPSGRELTRVQADVDIAAHGLSVIEIKKDGDNWQVQVGSNYNRRITPDTEMIMTGPAAGNDRLVTPLSPNGIRTFGTYYNCAGGVTPWGTILTGEENINRLFSGDPTVTREAENYARMGTDGNSPLSWAQYYERWNLDISPQEPMHFGWVVEIDPHNPESLPRKRTALGRCKHEGCNVYIDSDNTVVAYTGDDQMFEYVYKFISDRKYDPANRESNMRLLEEGTLYAARFNDSGTLDWLPLVFGQGSLTPVNGFRNQGDVMLDSRKAADMMGATPMDRPEDVEVNPRTGKVYVTLTNNSQRPTLYTNKANPRAENRDGQILEFWPIDGHHREETFHWDMFVLAGNPATEEIPTQYHPDISENGWLSCPDNIAFDNIGNLWVASDGAQSRDIADGMWATEVDGPNRALTKRFIRGPIGCELTGPFFTPNSENFFCSIQHPGGGRTYEDPVARWPDFQDHLPPRPSVVVVTKTGGGRVGS